MFFSPSAAQSLPRRIISWQSVSLSYRDTGAVTEFNSWSLTVIFCPLDISFQVYKVLILSLFSPQGVCKIYLRGQREHNRVSTCLMYTGILVPSWHLMIFHHCWEQPKLTPKTIHWTLPDMASKSNQSITKQPVIQATNQPASQASKQANEQTIQHYHQNKTVWRHLKTLKTQLYNPSPGT